MPRLVRLALLILPALLMFSACATAAHGPVTSAPTEELVLRVSSEADKLTVYLSDGAVRERVGTVMGGRTEVLRIRRRLFGTVYLTAESVHGRVDFVAEWTPGSLACWSWSLPRTGFRTHDISRFPVPCREAAMPAGEVLAEAPRDTLRPTSTSVSLDERWLGVATCASKPVAWIREDVIDTEEGPQVRAHERAHVQSMFEIGGCAAHELWASVDPHYILDLESVAYCASSRTWAGQMQLPLEYGIRRFAAVIAYSYRFGLSAAESFTVTPEEAYRRIVEAGCKS